MTSTPESTLHRMVDALEAVDRARLEAVFAAGVRLRASLPSRDRERTGRAAAAELMLAWYRDATDITRVHDVVDSVGDVWHAGWRFTMCEAGAGRVVEQHAYCTVTDGAIESIRMICSGFRPAGSGPDLTRALSF